MSLNLQYLDLGVNMFSGQVPIEFSQLTSLKNLILWQNHFTGTIPPTLGNLNQLVTLELPYNDIFGTMPELICSLRNKALQILSTDCQVDKNHVVPKVACSCCTTCY